MNERLAAIRQEIMNGIEERATSRATAFELRKQFMDSKTGKIGQLMKEMTSIAPEERAAFGKSVNELKAGRQALEQLREETYAALPWHKKMVFKYVHGLK